MVNSQSSPPVVDYEPGLRADTGTQWSCASFAAYWTRRGCISTDGILLLPWTASSVSKHTTLPCSGSALITQANKGLAKLLSDKALPPHLMNRKTYWTYDMTLPDPPSIDEEFYKLFWAPNLNISIPLMKIREMYGTNQPAMNIMNYINWFVTCVRHIIPPFEDSYDGITRDTPVPLRTDQIGLIHSH